ncbi:MAG TPA: EscU/YscU/HrcU family type III secretion system export apparatus switch protein [Bryobacteraceae bacterium]|nr:EscU/YscU/HrcU family type III secretion system export apparatus switch protein [Bryobacteraceae bacterium]
MSGQKTEQPTPKRIKDARKEGQVFRSSDITQALLFLTAVGVLSMAGPAYIEKTKDMMRSVFQPDWLTGRLSGDEILRRAGATWGRQFILMAPLLGALFMVAGAVTFFQVKALFAPTVLKPKFDRLNPIKGFQNIFFKGRTYLEAAKTLIKFAAVLALCFFTIRGDLRQIILTGRADLEVSATLAMNLMFGLLFKVAGVFLVLGGADYMLQKKLYIKGLMMSRYDVMKEYKEEEGDPHMKHARKQLHEELLAHGMTQAVPQATAVVVNPTHLAVAIRYDEKTMNAPAVTAKGQFTMADRIREMAREHHIPIVRNVPLAHALFNVELDQDIPEDMYEAVAEVLNWVYQLTQHEEA